jgi:hypothetical protein
LLGALWGAGGLAIVLLDAINRLSGIAMQAIDEGLDTTQWVLFIVIVFLMAYLEGYRGFQKSFSPRSAARTYYLYKKPELLTVIFAPLFVMGFFRAARGPLLFAWVGTCLIVLLIVFLQLSAQPWRGIIDAGVVVGLSWGLISLLIELWRVFSTGVYPLPPAVRGATED